MSIRIPKPTGLIEPPSSTELLHTKRYKVHINKKTFILTVYETYGSFILYLGGYRKFCVEAQIIKHNTTFEEEGNLVKVRHDVECSTDKDKDPFMEGKDTVLITRVMLSYIKNTFPGVKYMEFTDTSTRKCNDGSSIELSAMKFFTDGKTWYLPDPMDQEGMQSTGEYYFASGLYEAHFNASIHPDSEYSYQQMSTYANEKKKITTWNEYYERFLTHVKSPLRIEDLEIIYTSSNTFQEFFSEVRRRIGIADFCTWLSTHSWFNTNFLKFVRFNTFRLTFRMDISLFNESYTTEVMTGGWRGKTRKSKINHLPLCKRG